MMHDSINSYKRTVFVLSILIIFYLVIIFSLYSLQIKKSEFFSKLGAQQYNITITTTPPRAYIYDRNNTPIALNKDSFSAFILPKQITSKQATYSFLKKHFPESYTRLQQAGDKQYFIFIKRRISPEELQLIQEANIEDIHILKEPSRYYPYACLGPVLGYTDIDNEGIFGAEQKFNSYLQGTQTQQHLQQDAKSNHFYFNYETLIEGEKGKPLTLTIDADLQFKVQNILDEHIKSLGSKEGGALILNPETGQIDAMVSNPYFNPHETSNFDIETTKNRPISQAFELGSVVKTFSALAALQEHVTTIDEMIDCENTLETKIGGIRVRTVKENGVISFSQVIQDSNNIGTVKVVKRLGEKLYDYYKLVGFGELTGIQLPGEHKGFVNHPKNWSAYSIISLSFGYEITTTLLQLARAIACIANGGYVIQPTIIKVDSYPEKTTKILHDSTVSDLRTILEKKVTQIGGKNAYIDGYSTFGKTGTANILEHGKYNEDKHLYTFIGWVEKGDYKRVIVTFIKETNNEYKRYAASVTAPLFKKITEALLIHDHIIA